MTTSDEQLMLAYKAGNDSALQEIFVRYSPLLLRVLSRDLDRPDEAHDLMQQTFLQLHRARLDFRDDSKLRPWLMTIALNLKRKYYRRRSRRPQEDGTFEVDDLVGQSIEEPGDTKRLADALLKLRPKVRDIMILYWFEGFSFPEIAEIVGAKPSAVKVRAHRGKQQLRKLLGEDVTVEQLRDSST